MCLVGKQFFHLEVPILHRTAVITPEKLRKHTCSEMDGLRSNLRRRIVDFARDLTIRGSGFDWEFLEKLLAEMKQLDIVHWSSWEESIPKTVLDCLSTNHPECAIYIENLELGDTPYMTSPRDGLSLLDDLSGCKSIRFIELNIDYNERESTGRIKEVLMSCPNLEILHLRDPSATYSMDSLEHGTHDICVEVGNQLPRVRELVYESHSKHRTLIPNSF
ncbi:uncharacterized protein LY89DRAFT_504870 [Mollisia scopiformis]|uniref:FBD domain-containing protein n=1 Tax=Mollisia scopiformis TaxID=149040 RepID=A0A194XG78_MOLSC|nr:uncharacterized protein LY89DRAFT_504870 [Mollisia scopiformis]KUJ18782.1 hypothetical protein LY89DRAFT_504870 [Mollisia scopiformis]